MAMRNEWDWKFLSLDVRDGLDFFLMVSDSPSQSRGFSILVMAVE